MQSRLIEKEGPTNFIYTTTAPELHPENETRHWSLLVDESPAQTAAVKKETARKYTPSMPLSQDEIVSSMEMAASEFVGQVGPVEPAEKLAAMWGGIKSVR